MHEEYMRQALDLARQAAACGGAPAGLPTKPPPAHSPPPA